MCIFVSHIVPVSGDDKLEYANQKILVSSIKKFTMNFNNLKKKN